MKIIVCGLVHVTHTCLEIYLFPTPAVIAEVKNAVASLTAQKSISKVRISFSVSTVNHLLVIINHLLAIDFKMLSCSWTF
jgi:hypothetical protein